MNQNRTLIFTAVMVSFLLLFVGIGDAEIMNQRWVLYGTSDMGDSYYDESSITEVGPKVIQVWNKDKYSNIGKELIIQGRKNLNLSIAGYHKLDYVADILELDCVNRTIKDIFFVEYDNEGAVLYEYDFPTLKTIPVLSGSIQETLLHRVCPK